MRLENVSFSYGEKEIIKDLSIEFKKNKITTIIGPNGSGKSTLMQLLAGLEKPHSGHIYIDDKEIQTYKIKELAKKIAVVHQKNHAPKDVNVETIVGYGRLPYLKFGYTLNKEDYDIIEWAMQITGVEAIRHEMIGNLSGGQSQRVWIAMALAQKTDILLLDEPTTYLDIKYQNEILELVEMLNKKFNMTIVMVLHDINQALSYSHQLIGLKDGKQMFYGEAKDILTSKRLHELYDYPLEIVKYENQTFIITTKKTSY